MADYWIHLPSVGWRSAVLNGPHHTYSAAWFNFGERESVLSAAGQRENAAKPKVLLDLNSIDFSDQFEVEKILMDDPVLKAVFEMGRQAGELGRG